MTNKNDEYFNSMEKYCFETLTKLNHDQEIWETLDQLPKFHCCDASGQTSKGCKCLIELKARTGDTSHFNDLFIESKKVAYLLLAYITEGFIPLYINYTECKVGELPKKIWVWRLDRLNRFKYIPSIRTWSSGYGKAENGERFSFGFDDATMYQLDDETNTYLMVNNRNAYKGCE